MTIELSDEDKNAILDQVVERMAVWDDQAAVTWNEIDKEMPASQVADTNVIVNRIMLMLRDRASDLYYAISKLPRVISGRTAAVCTDDTTIWFNPTWFASRPDEELLHTVAFIAQIVKDRVNFICDVLKERTEKPDWHIWSSTCNLLANRRVLDLKIGILPTESAFITSVDPCMGYIELYDKFKDLKPSEISKMVWPLLELDKDLFKLLDGD